MVAITAGQTDDLTRKVLDQLEYASSDGTIKTAQYIKPKTFNTFTVTRAKPDAVQTASGWVASNILWIAALAGGIYVAKRTGLLDKGLDKIKGKVSGGSKGLSDSDFMDKGDNEKRLWTEVWKWLDRKLPASVKKDHNKFQNLNKIQSSIKLTFGTLTGKQLPNVATRELLNLYTDYLEQIINMDELIKKSINSMRDYRKGLSDKHSLYQSSTDNALHELYNIDYDIRQELKIKNSSQITKSKTLQAKYLKVLFDKLARKMNLVAKLFANARVVFKELEDDDRHILNVALGILGVYGASNRTGAIAFSHGFDKDVATNAPDFQKTSTMNDGMFGEEWERPAKKKKECQDPGDVVFWRAGTELGISPQSKLVDLREKFAPKKLEILFCSPHYEEAKQAMEEHTHTPALFDKKTGTISDEFSLFGNPHERPSLFEKPSYLDKVKEEEAAKKTPTHEDAFGQDRPILYEIFKDTTGETVFEKYMTPRLINDYVGELNNSLSYNTTLKFRYGFRRAGGGSRSKQGLKDDLKISKAVAERGKHMGFKVFNRIENGKPAGQLFFRNQNSASRYAKKEMKYLREIWDKPFQITYKEAI
jgi:hypothetical protein